MSQHVGDIILSNKHQREAGHMNRTYDIRNTKMYADEQGKLMSENIFLAIMELLLHKGG
jgi:hypothetical protein